MHSYLVLQDPGHNKVYFEQSKQLALAELTITCDKFIESCTDASIIHIAGIRYLSFKSNSELGEKSLELLSQMSFAFALYELQDSNGQEILIPISKSFEPTVDPKISSMLKYPGKTNELFTRMMINIAQLSGNPSKSTPRLFDPIAGRGTTLYEGMIYGFDVTGMEIKPQPVQEATQFLKKYFETEKIKHRFAKYKLKGKSKKPTALKLEFVYAKDKQLFKDPVNHKKVSFIESNSALANEYFKSNLFDFIVGDLPYGIAHNNASKSTNGSRNPYAFLKDSLDSWFDVLKPGGTIVLAWNSFLLDLDNMRELMECHGYTTLKGGAYDQFEHMVDRSIKRNVVVAVKK